MQKLTGKNISRCMRNNQIHKKTFNNKPYQKPRHTKTPATIGRPFLNYIRKNPTDMQEQRVQRVRLTPDFSKKKQIFRQE